MVATAFVLVNVGPASAPDADAGVCRGCCRLPLPMSTDAVHCPRPAPAPKFSNSFDELLFQPQQIHVIQQRLPA